MTSMSQSLSFLLHYITHTSLWIDLQVVDQACVKHRPYYKHLPKTNRPREKGTRSAKMLTIFLVLGLTPLAFFTILWPSVIQRLLPPFIENLRPLGRRVSIITLYSLLCWAWCFVGGWGVTRSELSHQTSYTPDICNIISFTLYQK